MAAIDYFLANALSDGWRRLELTAQGAATIADGWVVSTGSTNHSEYEVGVERAASTFTGTTVPDGTLDATLKDAFRSVDPLTGSFASANWVFHFVVRAVSNGGAQDGRIRFRIIKADADGSNATEITSGQQEASLVSNVSTGADFDSTLTVNPGAFSITNQYLFIQIAWERTGAGGMTTSDIAFRTGSSSSVGTRITTADFTQEVSGAHLASGASLFAGTVSAGQDVAGGTIASTLALFAGTVALVLAGAHIASGAALFAGNASMIASSTASSSVAVNDVSIAAPPGTVAGKVVLVFIIANAGGPQSITDNNGSTPFTRDLHVNAWPSSGGYFAIFSRRIQSGDPSTYNFLLETAHAWTAHALLFTDDGIPSAIYDASIAEGDFDDTTGDGNGTSFGVTTQTPHAIHVAFLTTDGPDVAITSTPSGYHVERNEGARRLAVVWKRILSPGATGNLAWTYDQGAAFTYYAGSLAIRTQPLIGGATIAAGSTLFAGVTALTAEGAHIASGAQLFAGTVAGGAVTVEGAHLSSTAALFAGTVGLEVAGATIASGAQTFAGALALQTAGGTIAAGSQVFAGAVDLVVSGATVAAGSQTFAGTLALQTAGAHIASGAQVFAGTVGQTVEGAHVASGAALFAGTVTEVGAVSGAHIASGVQVFAGTVALHVAGAHVASGVTLFAGAAGLEAAGAHVASGAALFAGSVALNVTGASIASGVALFAGTVTESGAVAGGTVASSAALFAGSVTLNVAGATIASTAQVFAGAAAPAVDGAFLPSGAATFAGTVGLGVEGGTVASGATLFAGTVSAEHFVTGGTIAAGSQVFAGAVGAVSAEPIAYITIAAEDRTIRVTDDRTIRIPPGG